MMEALTPSEASSKGFSAPLNITNDGSTLVTMCKAEAGPGLFTACSTMGASSSVPLVFGSGGDLSVLTGKKQKVEIVEACEDMYNATTIEATTSVPVVLSEGIGMDVLAEVTEKSDLTAASLSASLINETAVLVETPRGLVLSVGDEIRAVAYSNLASNAEDVQSTQLLSLGNTYIPVALLSQQNGLMEDQGGEVVFEGSGVAEVEGDGIVEQDGPIVCTTELPIVDQQGLTVPASDNEEPKKKNRGWPKGKRRKTTPEVCGPRAPMTGYVLYAIDRRQQIKQNHPHIHFTEVTKILGQEWSNMSPDKKQKYLEEAEKDKQRYIEELQAFQKSDVYQTLMKKKRLKDGDQSDEAGAAFTDLEDDTDELQCRACDLYFSSLHNKKEHLLGRQHLQIITDQLEKELKRQEQHDAALKENHSACEDIVSPDDSISDHGGNSEPCKLSNPVDVNSFIAGFVQKNYEREQEILALRQSLRKGLQENWSICKQIQQLRECESRLRQDLRNLAAHTATLSAQINNLKMVPMLFGISDF